MFDRLNGFLLVEKPEGITSQDVITRLQKVLTERSGIKKRDLPKIGHGGTLDPFATGLLVLAVGDGTKLARYLIDSEKTYQAEVRFGARTASGDLTNEVVETTDRRPDSREALERAAKEFVEKPYLQTPPMYSAKKVNGQRLHELARKGKEVERAAIECRVTAFSVRDFSGDTAAIETRVSSGTFIRTLAEDWAVKLGTLGHLISLRRLTSGPFRVENAVSIEALTETTDWTQSSAFIPFDRCLEKKLPTLSLDAEESRAIIEGRKEVIQLLAPRLPRESERVALYDDAGLRAVFFRTASAWDFERVFPRPGARLN